MSGSGTYGFPEYIGIVKSKPHISAHIWIYIEKLSLLMEYSHNAYGLDVTPYRANSDSM